MSIYQRPTRTTDMDAGLSSLYLPWGSKPTVDEGEGVYWILLTHRGYALYS